MVSRGSASRAGPAGEVNRSVRSIAQEDGMRLGLSPRFASTARPRVNSRAMGRALSCRGATARQIFVGASGGGQEIGPSAGGVRRKSTRWGSPQAGASTSNRRSARARSRGRRSTVRRNCGLHAERDLGTKKTLRERSKRAGRLGRAPRGERIVSIRCQLLEQLRRGRDRALERKREIDHEQGAV